MRRVRPTEITVVLGAAAVLGGSWVIAAAEEQVPEWEITVFEQVNGLPDALWPVLWAPMQVGSFVGSLAVAGAAVAISGDRRVGLAALVASQVGYWMAKSIKRLVDRGRPSAFIEDLHLREQADGLGYVSGHATVAFALAAALAPTLPRRWSVVAVVIVVSVAVARVYAGVHLPLDVIGGAGFGILLGTIARWAFGRSWL